MIIRDMSDKDLKQICDIENNIFSKPWSENDFKKSFLDKKNIYLVAEEDGEILGYCGLWDIVGEGQINNVAVKATCRRRQVANILLTAMIEKGKKQGIEAFTLEVRVSNQPAISLYHKLGFTDSGVRKNFYEAPTEDALIMWL